MNINSKTPCSKNSLLKDASHYLKRGYNLGSVQEIINSVKYVFAYTEELLCAENKKELANRDMLEHFELSSLNHLILH